MPPGPTEPGTGHVPPRRRRPFRRFVVFVGWVVIVVAVIAIIGVAYVETRLERIGPIPDSASNVYLIVGSDTREGLPDDLEGRFGSFAGERADVVILAHPDGSELRLLSLPRDLKVQIPGRGTDKINAAYAYGGLDLLAQTVSTNFGVPIGHAVRVDFGGFASIVDAVGGVELEFDLPTRDTKSGLLVEDGGRQTVDGATALGYVRSRSTEVLDGGTWRSLGGNDIDRTARQREVLEGIVDAARDPRSLVRWPAIVAASAAALAVDDDTHSWDLALFGLRLAFASERTSASLPVVGSTEGGVSYVVADGAAADGALAEFMS